MFSWSFHWLAFAIGASSPGVQVVFEARPIANLAAHIDCLASVRPCARAVYQGLWKDLGWSDADDKALLEWREVMMQPGIEWNRLHQQRLSTFPLPEQMLTPRNSLRVASIQARDLGDYEERLSLIVEPATAARLTRILGGFEARFKPFWQKAQSVLERQAKAGTALMQSAQFAPFVDSIAAFYGAELPPGGSVHVSLVYRPKEGSRNTTAQQLGNFSLVEIVDGEPIDERIDVVIHELCHYFYQEVPRSVHSAIIDRAEKSSAADVFSAYAMLNEVLAAAFGNALVAKKLTPKSFEKSLTTKKAFYNDETVDRAVKAALPLVESWIEHGEKLSAAHFDTYRTLMAQNLGTAMRSAALSLRSHVVTYEGRDSRPLATKLLSLSGASQQLILSPTSSPEVASEFYTYPDLTGVVLLTKIERPRLKTWEKYFGPEILERLRDLCGKHEGFVYGVKRTERAVTYVVIGEDEVMIEELLKKLTQSAEGFTGLGPVVN